MKPATPTAKTSWIPREAAEGMSAKEFACMDRLDTLYVRRIENWGGLAFEVYAGDGTYLDTVDTLDEVNETAFYQQMEVATVH